MKMMTPAQIALEHSQVLAAVASTLRLTALQRGGAMVADAADLHALGSGSLWPRSVLEMRQVILPDLTRRPGLAGCTVTAQGFGLRTMWHVTGEPLKPPAAPPQSAPRATAKPTVIAPTAAPRPAPAARHTYASASEFTVGARIPTDAEFEQVKREHDAYLAQRAARMAATARAREHAARVRDLAGSTIQRRKR
ncbi:MAG TPA: hypothetical protein VD932_01090 [Aquabacterium sp.]|nr:hypothetical protein [Aquabacterium sp.]